MSRAFSDADKARFLRALAHLVHRKRPVDDALGECFEMEGKGGKHKVLRPAISALQDQGAVAALQAAEMIGADMAAVFSVVIEGGDHRLISNVLTALADHLDQG